MWRKTLWRWRFQKFSPAKSFIYSMRRTIQVKNWKFLRNFFVPFIWRIRRDCVLNYLQWNYDICTKNYIIYIQNLFYMIRINFNKKFWKIIQKILITSRSLRTAQRFMTEYALMTKIHASTPFNRTIATYKKSIA